MVAQKRTSNPIRFTLDADAEVIDSGQVGQRIAAKNRRFIRSHLQPQDNKLTRLGDWKRLSVDRHQNERGHAIAFLADMRDSHPFESGPCWRLLLICEPGIPFHGFCRRLLFEHRLERTLPALAECWDPECAFHL